MAWIGLFACVLILGASPGCAPERETPTTAAATSAVLPELRTAFAKVNPAANRVWILDVGTRPWGSGHPDAGDEYAVVATAWQPGADPVVDGKFSGAGELFGVFVVDSTFSHVTRVLHIFPTRRWHDYRVIIDVADADSITVLAEGATFGDEPVGYRLDWDGRARREFVWVSPDSGRGQD